MCMVSSPERRSSRSATTSCQGFPPDFLHHHQKVFVLHHPLQGHPHMHVIGPPKVRQSLCLPHTLLEHQVHSLIGPLHQSTFGEDVRDPAVAGPLTVQHILGRDSWRRPRAFAAFTAVRTRRVASPLPSYPGATPSAATCRHALGRQSTRPGKGRRISLRKAANIPTHFCSSWDRSSGSVSSPATSGSLGALLPNADYMRNQI